LGLDPFDLGNPKAGSAVTARWAQSVNRSIKAQYAGLPRGAYFNGSLGILGRQPIIDIRKIPVRLTGRGTDDGFFQFTQVEWDTTTKDWKDSTVGQTHTVLGEAWERTGRKAIHLDEVVFLEPSDHVVLADGLLALEFDAPLRWIWVELTANSEISAPSNRWKLAWTEKIRSTTSFIATPWTALTGTVTVDFAINSIEDPNDAADIEGHGVDIDGTDYPGGFDVQPPDRGNPIVKLYENFDSARNRFYTIQFENVDDGTCT